MLNDTYQKKNNSRVIRGGRMTKWKGQVASISPCLAYLVSTVSVSALLTIPPISASAGSCVSAGSAGTYVCSGPASTDGTDAGVFISNNAGSTSVIATSDFGINTSGTTGSNAIHIQEIGNITFDDQSYGSQVYGASNGIVAQNFGTGTTTILSKGVVTGRDSIGIYTSDVTGTTGDTTVSAGTVSGGVRGIDLRNNGTGSVNLTTEGAISGTSEHGILVLHNNAAGTGDIGITTGDTVTGGTYGISARNDGTGIVTVTSAGKVTGTNRDGIQAVQGNSTSGGSVTVNVADVTGAFLGVYAHAFGDGAVTVTSTGLITSQKAEGIRAAQTNTSTDEDMTVSVNDVSGGTKGISALSSGTAAVHVTSTGVVDGAKGDGIYAYAAGTDINVDANTVTGTVNGILANNQGTGATTVNTNGDVAGRDNSGIYSINSTDATGNMTITVAGETATIQGQVSGIDARNNGTGSVKVESKSAVSSVNGDGILVLQNNAVSAGNAEVLANNVTGGTSGVVVKNQGQGALNVSSSGLITGNAGDGIQVIQSNASTDKGVTIDTADVAGTNHGIYAQNAGLGTISVTSIGTVQVTDTENGNEGIKVHQKNTAATGNVIVNAAAVTGNTTGIYTKNEGVGDTAITTNGDVVGTGNVGIQARNTATSTGNLSVTIGADVTGQTNGVDAVHEGAGSVTVAMTEGATGTVTGTNFGINALQKNGNGTGGVDVAVHSVVGEFNGIRAETYGQGAVTVTSTGAVTAQFGYGIVAAHKNLLGTGDITISVADATGAFIGVAALQYGGGAVKVTSSGQITGTAGDGLIAVKTDTNSDKSITLDVAGVSGTNRGIYTRNAGTAAISVTSTGEVIGSANDGMQVVLNNTSATGDVTISAAKVTGGASGINAQNKGKGAVSVTASDLVVGNGETQDGIHASTSGTDVTVNASAVTGGSTGVFTRNEGTGGTVITTSGDVTGSASFGIYAYNADTTVDNLEITAGANVSGQSRGIDAVDEGVGSVTVKVTGTDTLAKGQTSDGIRALQAHTGTTGYVLVEAQNVEGAEHGIHAQNDGTGAITVTSLGTVIGAAQEGIRAVHTHDMGTGDVTVMAAAVTGGTSGVYAGNAGEGAVMVTSTGQITGNAGDGIHAVQKKADASSAVTIEAQENVTGTSRGIYARNYGTGAISVTSNGEVSVTNTDDNSTDGIKVEQLNANAVGDVKITTAKVTGIGNGIFAENNGTGEINVQTSDIVTGGTSGIAVESNGNGLVNVTSTAHVTGQGNDGIHAFQSNAGASSDVEISATDVTAAVRGIYAKNEGSGSVRVTSTGHVTAENNTEGHDGILAKQTNQGATGDVIVSAASVSGGDSGIAATNDGTGSVNVTSTGLVTGGIKDGIHAMAKGKDLTINSGAVSGAVNGVFAYNEGSGSVTISTQGDITGSSSAGIYAKNTANGGDVVITVTNGVSTVNKNVSTASFEGVVSTNIVLPLTLNSNAVESTVTGSTSAILAKNYGTGATDITLSSTVLGGSEAAVQIFALADTDVDVKILDGADIRSNNGEAIVEGNANTTITQETGSVVTGSISLGGGSDMFHFNGGDISGLTLFDGGDDGSTTDGFFDAIVFSGTVNDAFDPGKFTNWEMFKVDGTHINLSEGTLRVGDGSAETGLFLTNGGVLSAETGFTLDGLTTISAQSTFDAGAGGITLNGDVMNDGLIVLANGTAGDTLTINGDLNGQGRISFDLNLMGDAPSADKLVVTGDLNGSASIDIYNIGDGEAHFSSEITLMDIGGALNMLPVLKGDYVTDDGQQAIIAGTYAYTLDESNGTLSLVSRNTSVEPSSTDGGTGGTDGGTGGTDGGTGGTDGGTGGTDGGTGGTDGGTGGTDGGTGGTDGGTGGTDGGTGGTDGSGKKSYEPRYQPGAPVFELYAQVLHELNDLPTFNDRQIASLNPKAQVLSFADNGHQDILNPFWYKLSGSHGKQGNHNGTTDADINITQLRLDAGADIPLAETGAGRIFGGVSLGYNKIWGDVSSHAGDGSINTKSIGVGLSATWIGNNGFYMDGQAKYRWFSSDLKSDKLGTIKNNNHGNGISASLELGQRISVSDTLVLIPQTQLSFSRVDFDNFEDRYNTFISQDDKDQWELRTGIVAEKQLGQSNTDRIYGMANLYYLFDDSTSIEVSGVNLKNKTRQVSGEIGMGAVSQIAEDAHLYSEVTGRAGVNGDYNVRGQVGMRWSF